MKRTFLSIVFLLAFSVFSVHVKAESAKDDDSEDEGKTVSATEISEGTEEKSAEPAEVLSEEDVIAKFATAMRTGNVEKIEALLDKNSKLLNKKDKFGRTPLFNAVQAKQDDVVEVLLKRKADVKIANTDGDTPLHRAAQSGNIKLIELLIQNSASVWSENLRGETPLFKAVSAGQMEAVKVLLKNKAEINAPDKKGDTCLHKATLKRDEKMIKFLIENGAEMSVKKKDDEKTVDLTPNLHKK